MHSLFWGNASTTISKVSVTILLHRAIEIKIFRVSSILLVAIGSVVSLVWIVLLETTCIPSRMLPKLGVADGGGWFLVLSNSRNRSTDEPQCYQFYFMSTLLVIRRLSCGHGMLLSKKGWSVVLCVGWLLCKSDEVNPLLGWRKEPTWVMVVLHQWWLPNVWNSKTLAVGYDMTCEFFFSPLFGLQPQYIKSLFHWGKADYIWDTTAGLVIWTK